MGQRADETVFPTGLGGPMGVFAAGQADGTATVPACTFEMLSGTGQPLMVEGTVFRFGSGKDGRGGGVAAFLIRPGESLSQAPASASEPRVGAAPFGHCTCGAFCRVIR